ncbi:MAG TPA: hypothetical protein VH575_32385 [Gemmataceae bacterium]|jgi:hypothetical protein
MTEPAKMFSQTWRPTPPRYGATARRLRVALLAVVVLALSGALIAWLIKVRPLKQADFLPLCIDEYGDDFPVRAWVRQDGELLRGLTWNEDNAFTVQERELLLHDLRAFTQRKSKGPQVVYLNALALTDAKGELNILPVDARLDHPSTWLPLREVFARLRASGARHKLLLLDIMQPFPDARRGVLSNDAAERLRPLLDEVLPNDPHLSVLCACSPGQTSIVAEELGHSVFAYYLREGLRRQAEKEPTADGRVSLQELASYVTREVEQWTWQHRRARQTPRLYGAQEDYPLAAVNPSVIAAEPEPEADYPDWLRDGWKLRDKWWNEGGYRHMPDVLRQLESVLLRAEQQWRGGVRSERVQRGLAARRERLERQHDEQSPVAAAPESLAQATARGRKPPEGGDEEAIAVLRDLAVRHARTKAVKAGEAELKQLAADIEQQKKKFAGKPLALAWVVFRAADTDALSAAAFRFLADLLAQARGSAYAETRLLSQLAELPTADDWPAESVRQALRTKGEAEIVAAADPHALPWVREAREQADRLRREGEKLLHARLSAERRRAEVPLRQAWQSYRAIKNDLHTVEEALICRDQMLLRLPAYAAYLEIDDSTEQAWENALTTTRRLRQVLAAPSAPDGTARAGQIRAMAELTATLQNDPNNLNSLRRPQEGEQFNKLIARSRIGDCADVKIMTALLETPWLPVEPRVQLWTARRTLLREVGRKHGETPPTWDEARGVAAERRQALRRAHRSLELLKLESIGSTDQVETALRQAEQSADAARLAHLAEKLRQAWARRDGANP